MRKFYSVLAASLLAASAFAQTKVNINKEYYPAIRSYSNMQSKELRKADPTSNWYIPGEFLLGQVTYTNSINPLNGDTLAKWIGSDGKVSRASAVDGAMGQIVDAHDDAIDLIDATQTTAVPKFSKFTNYTADSITMNYSYIRRVDSVMVNGVNQVVKDTLFIYYFKGTQISTTGSLVDPTGGSKPTRFGNLSWDFAKRAPANYTSMDTLILDRSRATALPNANGWNTDPLNLPIKTPLVVNSNNGASKINLVGFAIKFKSGIVYDSSYVIEDRRDSLAIPANTKWINYFNGSVMSNTGVQVENNTFFNSTLLSPLWYPYAEFNGWKGFVSGYATTNATYSTLGMFLTSTNVGIREKTDNFVLGNAFPNPSTGNVSISFRMISNDNVNISVYNLMGQKVAEVANGKYTTGEHTITAELGSLKAGIYLYTMTTGASSQTQKLTITE